VQKRTKITLIVVAAVAAVTFVAVLHWYEARFPLRYVKPERVHLARARGVRSRRARELKPAELAELCALLRAAPRVESFDGRRTVGVELTTPDYGTVRIYDLGGPGANLLIRAGEGGEETCTVRSGRLGEFLAGLSAELAEAEPAPAPGNGG
jgi:hypothetical protein